MKVFFEKVTIYNMINKSSFVLVIIKLREFLLETFSLTNSNNEFCSLSIFIRESLDDAPVVKNVLGESLSLGVSSKCSSKTERL